jgi:type IV pilus assembly protein PilW
MNILSALVFFIPSPLAGEGRGEGYRREAATRNTFTLTPTLSRQGRGRRETGLTLVEVMVALVISLILLAGLVVVFSSMRSSFATTSRLNHLVNQERLVSNVLGNTLANAGYYPLTNRTVRGTYHDALRAFPAETATVYAPVAFTAGQVIYGTGETMSGSRDTVAIRMFTASDDRNNIFDCQGGTNKGTAGSAGWERSVNVLWVKQDTHQLMCTVSINGASPVSAPLVGGDLLPVAGTVYGGVTSFIVTYGVDTDGSGSVDRYMSAKELNSDTSHVCPEVSTNTGAAASCWPYVRSARIKLGFLTALGTAKKPKTLYLTRSVVLANAIGRNIGAPGFRSPSAGTADTAGGAP